MLDTTPRQPRIPLLGLCPIGKFVFSHEHAMRQKAALKQKLDEWQVRYVDLEGVVEDGMVRDQNHVDPAAGHFLAHNVDALFLPHCNFGTEGAAAMIGRKVGVPTLLWGPRDEAPLADGTRLRDTLCGMFATSKVLRKLHVPFSYIENCRVDERQLQEGLDRFLPAFQLREGPITVARFDGDTGDYQLAVGQGHTMDGPRNREQYVWMRVDDWPHWERILIEGPFIHHVAMQYGSYAAALEDACRFIPGLKPVRLERTKCSSRRSRSGI